MAAASSTPAMPVRGSTDHWPKNRPGWSLASRSKSSGWAATNSKSVGSGWVGRWATGKITAAMPSSSMRATMVSASQKESVSSVRTFTAIPVASRAAFHTSACSEKNRLHQ